MCPNFGVTDAVLLSPLWWGLLQDTLKSFVLSILSPIEFFNGNHTGLLAEGARLFLLVTFGKCGGLVNAAKSRPISQNSYILGS